MEYLDVVDEDDNVIDKASRKDCHENKLLHRAVHIMILNSQGELLLQKRTMNKDTNPGFWGSSASGHIDSGDKYRETAHRELKEELGIETDLEEIEFIRCYFEEHRENIKIFLGKHDGPFTLNPEEVDAIEFVKPGKIKREIRLYVRKFTPQFQQAFKKLCEVKGL